MTSSTKSSSELSNILQAKNGKQSGASTVVVAEGRVSKAEANAIVELTESLKLFSKALDKSVQELITAIKAGRYANF